MESYRPLYRVSVTHEYFERKTCTALQCCLSSQGKLLARQRGLMFRQSTVNEWEVFYDTEGAGVDTANDVLEMELHITDPDFVNYTEWKDFCPSATYTLELPLSTEENDATTLIRLSDEKRKVGSPFCSIRLHLTEKLIEAAQKRKPTICNLHFHTPSLYWEYIFIPMRSIYNCRLRLVVKSREDGSLKRILLRQVGVPDLGKFESNRGDSLRQVCYY